jgi:tRNA G10  N-methylase Trm11
MIEGATKNLTDLGIYDKFELICADMFDENFELPEKVDAVICSYVLTTFLTNFDDLKKILK